MVEPAGSNTVVRVVECIVVLVVMTAAEKDDGRDCRMMVGVV